jgi:hypothetical protein
MHHYKLDISLARLVMIYDWLRNIGLVQPQPWNAPDENFRGPIFNQSSSKIYLSVTRLTRGNGDQNLAESWLTRIDADFSVLVYPRRIVHLRSITSPDSYWGFSSIYCTPRMVYTYRIK